MGSLAMLGLGALVAGSYFNQDTPAEGFQAAQVQVQKAADAAKPHVMGMADVIKRQIEVVKDDAAAQTAANTAKPAPVRVAMVVRQASWQDRTSAKYCYSTGYRDNVACYASPR